MNIQSDVIHIVSEELAANDGECVGIFVDQGLDGGDGADGALEVASETVQLTAVMPEARTVFTRAGLGSFSASMNGLHSESMTTARR